MMETVVGRFVPGCPPQARRGPWGGLYQEVLDIPVRNEDRYVFCSWEPAMEEFNSIFCRGVNKGVPMTVYFHDRLKGRSRPMRRLDSVELEMAWVDYWLFLAQSIKWLESRSRYSVSITNKLLFQHLKPVLEECYGPTDEGGQLYDEMMFLCCVGSRDLHGKFNTLDFLDLV